MKRFWGIIIGLAIILVVPFTATALSTTTALNPGDTNVVTCVNGRRLSSWQYGDRARYLECLPQTTTTTTPTSTSTSTSTSTTTTTTTTTPPPTGAQPPASVTGGATWRSIFADEFSGTAVDTSKWNILTANDATWGSGHFVTGNVSVSNGSLHLLGKDDKSTGGVTTRSYGHGEKFAFKHGYIEIRTRLPSGSHWWPAFWLVGASGTPGWPCYGEFDVMEWYGPRPQQYEATTHWCPNGTSGHQQQGGAGIHYPNSSTAQEWHTYGLWWTSTSLKYVLDGQIVQQFNPVDAGSQQALQYAHTIIVDQQMGDGSFSGSATEPPADFPTGDYQVDYVRVFQP